MKVVGFQKIKNIVNTILTLIGDLLISNKHNKSNNSNIRKKIIRIIKVKLVKYIHLIMVLDI